MRHRYPIFSLLGLILCAFASGQEPTGGQAGAAEIEVLRRRVEALEKMVSPKGNVVDLSDEPALRSETPRHILARPWYENFDISGFIAIDYLLTGEAAPRRDGGFAVREAALFVEGEVADGVTAFFEIRTDYKALDSFNVNTGEVYCHFRNVIGDDGTFNLKVGRFDVPFSEEYLHEHPCDNPLILNSAHWWYGTDEGILAYGKLADLGWVGSITNGSGLRNNDVGSELAATLKAYGNLTKRLYLSGSVFRNGKTPRGGLRFAGSDFEPVGQNGTSTAGASPSKLIDAWAYALDGRCDLGERTYVQASFGQAWVDDAQAAFDRDFLWYSVEAHHELTDKVYAAARFSTIGTFDANEGYHFDGTITAGGNQTFGYDTREFQRVQLGLGVKPDQRTVVKFEGGYDRFVTIDGSPVDPKNGQRWFVGAELVVSF